MHLADARRGLDAGEIDPVDLTSSCLERIDATDEVVKAWLLIDAEGALARARVLRDGKPKGPLWGIPFAVKDIIDVAGLATTASSRVLSDNLAASDAPVVKMVREAGAVILGKTNTQEFAYGIVTFPTTNPWDKRRIPGGSSGGSAAAVAVSQCLGALGSDTAGSIRIPSALCGVSGLKPRPNVIPIEGVIPLAPTFDAVGPIARTAEDLALIYNALVESDLRLDLVAETRSLGDEFRLALPHDRMLPEIDPAVEKAYLGALEVLRSIAASTIEVDSDTPALEEFDFPRSVVLMSEALEVHRSRGWWPEHAGDYTDETRSYLAWADHSFAESIKPGVFFDWSAYPNYEPMLAECRELGARLASFLDKAEVLAIPTVPRGAPTYEEASVADEETPRRPVVVDLTRICGPINVAGLAALSVPCGFTDEGLPVGLQLVGGDERVLLRAGMAYQRETDWHLRRPPPAAR